MALMTLGYGLFINLDANSGLASMIIYQLVAGFGSGPEFQAPVLALQASVGQHDTAAVTTTSGFVRSIATSISVVIGTVIFQNGMSSRAAKLEATLGSAIAAQLSGSEADANVSVVGTLPSGQREVAQSAYADSLKMMWILYVCLSALGGVASIFVEKRTLTKEHQETQVGLALEAEKKEIMEKEMRRRKAQKDSREGVANETVMLG